MCNNCGCVEPASLHHTHQHSSGLPHLHEHKKGQEVTLGVDVLKVNNEYANRNREFFKSKGLYVVNLIGSPGCGKTTLVEALAKQFGDAMVVIEGDIQTRRDAERVIRAGSRAWQIETNGACHLDAHSVGHAIEHLDIEGCKLLVIENVGNLVCPSTYDLGEDEKVAVLSIAEGDDKVLKYPALFHRIGVLLLTKIDLAPYLEFDFQKVYNECRSLNRSFRMFKVSAKTGEGLNLFFDYLAAKAEIKKTSQ